MSIHSSSTNDRIAPESFFQRRDPWGHGLALWVVALLLFVGPIALFSLKSIRLESDVENWLPENDPSAREFAWCRHHFPEQESLIITWEGSALSDPRLPLLVRRLQGSIDPDGVRRGGLPYVSSVMHAGDLLSRMDEYGVRGPEAVRRLEGTLLGRGWLKVRLAPQAAEHSEESLRTLVDRARTKLGIQLAVHPAARVWTPSASDAAAFVIAQSQVQTENSTSTDVTAATEVAPHDYQLSWPGMASDSVREAEILAWLRSTCDAQGHPIVDDCFFTPGSPLAVVVNLSEAGDAEKPVALKAIRDAAIASFIPDKDVILGGRVVSSVELNQAVARSAWNPAARAPWKRSVILLSGLVGVFFALVSLRSIRLGLLVVGVSYYAALLGMAVVPLTGGSMNMVLIVMPTLLMVLSLSGAIHVANYWKHAVWEDASTAVTKATQMASQPCLLAGVTTALGLISLAGSQLAPVRDFGIYAAIGTLISVAMVLYGLPSLLQMIPLRKSRPVEAQGNRFVIFGEWLCRNARWCTMLSLLVAIGCGLGLRHFRVETKVIRYFPAESQVVQDFRKIEESLAGICPVEIVLQFNGEAQQEMRFLERLEVVRRVEEAVRQHPEVSGALSLAAFQPEREAPARNATTREKILYNKRSSEAEKRTKSGAAEGARELLTTSGSRPDGASTGEQDNELWRINAQCSILSDVDYNDLTDELHQRVAEITGPLAGVDHLVTGTVPLFLRTQRAVLESLIWSFIMAFAMIAIVMVIVLKDALAGVLSMVPNILPVLSVFGLVSWCGQRIDIGTMVTASVALGIAVDGTLHLLTWFQDGLRKGWSRERSVVAALAHCGPAMWQTSAAVGLGLLVLLPADLLLISRFGWLMASLILAALLGDLLLLPALLVGTLGRWIELGVQRRGEVRKDVEPQDNSAIALTQDGSVQEDAAPSLVPAPHLGRRRVASRPRGF